MEPLPQNPFRGRTEDEHEEKRDVVENIQLDDASLGDVGRAQPRKNRSRTGEGRGNASRARGEPLEHGRLRAKRFKFDSLLTHRDLKAVGAHQSARALHAPHEPIDPLRKRDGARKIALDRGAEAPFTGYTAGAPPRPHGRPCPGADGAVREREPHRDRPLGRRQVGSGDPNRPVVRALREPGVEPPEERRLDAGSTPQPGRRQAPSIDARRVQYSDAAGSDPSGQEKWRGLGSVARLEEGREGIAFQVQDKRRLNRRERAPGGDRGGGGPPQEPNLMAPAALRPTPPPGPPRRPAAGTPLRAQKSRETDSGRGA